MRNYLPEKVLIHQGRKSEVNIILRVDKILLLYNLYIDIF